MVLKARLSDHLSPAEQRDLDEAIEAISSSDLLRGIALGIEAARMVVVQAHAMVSPDSPAGILLDGCDHTIRSLNPADIAAKNPEKGQP